MDISLFLKSTRALLKFQTLNAQEIEDFASRYVFLIMMNEVYCAGTSGPSVNPRHSGRYSIEISTLHKEIVGNKKEILVTFIHELIHVFLFEEKIPADYHREQHIDYVAYRMVEKYHDNIEVFFSNRCKHLDMSLEWRAK